MDTQDQAIYCVWIHFIPTSLYSRREQTFSLSWNRTQVLLLYKQPLRPLDHGSFGMKILVNLNKTQICSLQQIIAVQPSRQSLSGSYYSVLSLASEVLPNS